MRRLPKVLVAILVLALIPSFPASAAVKTGSTCMKLNENSTISGFKYTCIKSGKKLVWSKGVKVATTSSTNGSVDQVKAKIELEKVDINREMIFRLSNKTLQRKANSGNYYVNDSRPVTEFDPIRVATFNAVLAHSLAKTHPKIAINYEIRDSFPKALADYSVKMIESSANYWNDLIEESATVTVQLFTEKDRDWINSQPMKFGTMDENLDRLAAWDSNNPQMIFFTGGGGYWEAAGVTKGLLSLATSSAAYPERMNFEWATVASHEFTHIIQGYFFRNLKNLPDEQYAAASPANFREGNAIIFGYIVSLQNLGWYSDMLDRNLFDGLNAIKTWMPVKTESNVVALLEATEKFSPNQAQAVAYSIGALFYEWVISKYGFEKFYDLAKGAASTSNYAQNIERSFGVPKETLYKLAAPYILKNINRVLNK